MDTTPSDFLANRLGLAKEPTCHIDIYEAKRKQQMLQQGQAYPDNNDSDTDSGSDSDEDHSVFTHQPFSVATGRRKSSMVSFVSVEQGQHVPHHIIRCV